jgi:acyl carrier protein
VTEAEVYAGLNEMFHELFADDDITLKPETTAADVDGWDSFNNLNIMVAVESRFGIKMSTKEIESFKDIGDLVSLVLARTNGSSVA